MSPSLPLPFQLASTLEGKLVAFGHALKLDIKFGLAKWVSYMYLLSGV